MSIVDRTILLVDCKENVGGVIGDLNFQINKARKTETIVSVVSLQKSALSCVVESVAEYSRILYDLFPDETQVFI